MTEFEHHIKYELADGIARLTLNRPPLNILNIEMMREMNRALEEMAGVSDLKLLVVNAMGKSFSAGVDVGEHTGDQAVEMIKVFHKMFRLMIRLNKPTLAVVNGSALGGGCELATFCDMVVASENAKFGQPEIQVGVLPPIACIIFPRIITSKKALELLLTGAIISAQEAETIGLINKCVPADKLKAEADKLIGNISGLSAPVLGYTKKAALIRFNKEFLEELAEVEDIYLNQLMKTEDANEGLKAFLEKRKPEWRNK